MTTPLPAAPSMEQLRKQAKELVRERRAGAEPLRLSDAQRELARDYGFPSWPRLKAYVERVSAHGPALTHAFVDELDYYQERANGLRSVVASGLESAHRHRAHLPPGAGERERRGDPRHERGRCPARAGARARLRELGAVPPARAGAGRQRRAVPARLPRHPGARPRRAQDVARPLSGPRPRTRHQRQRPARARGEHALRAQRQVTGARAARARRGSEQRQRPRLDGAPPGRLRQRPRPRRPAARGGRTHRSLRARRRRHAARGRALLGARRAGRLPGRTGDRPAQPAHRGGPRAAWT